MNIIKTCVVNGKNMSNTFFLLCWKENKRLLQQSSRILRCQFALCLFLICIDHVKTYIILDGISFNYFFAIIFRKLYTIDGTLDITFFNIKSILKEAVNCHKQKLFIQLTTYFRLKLLYINLSCIS